jgi:hypothetical protein
MLSGKLFVQVKKGITVAGAARCSGGGGGKYLISSVCAREKENRKFTVTKEGNMCP